MRFWSPSNRSGLCLLCKHLFNIQHVNSIETFLLSCPSLSVVRSQLQESFTIFCQNNPELSQTVENCLASQPMQFILDCSVIDSVILEVQTYGPKVLFKLFKLTRNFCFVMHKNRLQLLSSQLNSQ